jgi:hypothetical protein
MSGIRCMRSNVDVQYKKYISVVKQLVFSYGVTLMLTDYQG